MLTFNTHNISPHYLDSAGKINKNFKLLLIRLIFRLSYPKIRSMFESVICFLNFEFSRFPESFNVCIRGLLRTTPERPVTK